MKYKDLRDFIAQLEHQGELKRVAIEIDPHLEMTEICDRVLKAGGPAILFEKPKGHTVPVLGNLFGTPRRVAMGMGQESVEALREVGKLLAYLKEPEPPKGLMDAWEKFPVLKQVLNMAPKVVSGAPLSVKRVRTMSPPRVPAALRRPNVQRGGLRRPGGLASARCPPPRRSRVNSSPDRS